MAEHSTVNRRVTGSSPVGGADIARTPERSSGVLAIYVPLARTSNPSGLRPRRGKDFWFLARSENLRLAGSSPVGGAKLKASERSSEAFPFSRRDSNAVTTALGAGAGAPTPNFVWSSPVGTFPLSREPVTTPPYVSAGAPTPNPSGLRPRRDNGFLLPRALGKTVTPLCRVQSGGNEPFFARRRRRTPTGPRRR